MQFGLTELPKKCKIGQTFISDLCVFHEKAVFQDSQVPVFMASLMAGACESQLESNRPSRLFRKGKNYKLIAATVQN